MYRKPYLHSPAYSEECWEGDGNCDGVVYETPYAGEDCGCSCHTGPDFQTVEEVMEYHEDMKQYR